MASITEPIGFVADADHYCVDCAERVYGPDSEDRRDFEGNLVGVMFRTEEVNYPVGCCVCYVELDVTVLEHMLTEDEMPVRRQYYG